jgi:rare lipoprotein A
MLQPNQIKDLSRGAVRRTQSAIEHTWRDFPDAAVSTARVIISAEEKLRQRLRSVLRVALATLFLGISGLISLGANVTMAFAKKVSPEAARDKRDKNPKAKFYLRHSDEKLSIRKKAHGVASWYGGKFHNRKTASGVRFDTHAMMAAHRTLPFGTLVRVTNMTNHKSCVVTITDRGPFAHHRIIDLSLAAAEKIGMTHAGTAKVELEVMGSESMFEDIASESFEDKQSEKGQPVFDQIPGFPKRTLASELNVAEVADVGQ